MWRVAFPTLAALAVGLALTACGGSNSTAETSATATTASGTAAAATTGATSTTGAETDTDTDIETTTTDATGTTEAATAANTAGSALRIEIEDDHPVGGVKELTVSKGDTVTIEVSTDTPQEIHIHGYELEQEARPGAPAKFKFAADLEGIFDVESHASKAQLAKLVVEP
jgi:hypothetical protein